METHEYLESPIPWSRTLHQWHDRMPAAAHWMADIYGNPYAVSVAATVAGWTKSQALVSETEGVLLAHDHHHVAGIVGRGTDFKSSRNRWSLRDLYADFQHWRRSEARDLGVPKGIGFAAGSINHLRREWPSISSFVSDQLDCHGDQLRLWVTGHSLFAGVAAGPLVPALVNLGCKNFEVYAFEPPRTAGVKSAAWHKELCEANGVKVYSIRTIADGVGDLVTLIPPKSFPFRARHTGRRVVLVRSGETLKFDPLIGDAADAAWLRYKETVEDRWIRNLPSRIRRSIAQTHSSAPIARSLAAWSVKN